MRRVARESGVLWTRGSSLSITCHFQMTDDVSQFVDGALELLEPRQQGECCLSSALLVAVTVAVTALSDLRNTYIVRSVGAAYSDRKGTDGYTGKAYINI